MSAPVLSVIRVSAEADSWAAAGFSVSDGELLVGGVSIEFVAGAGGIVGWTLTDARTGDVALSCNHANGVTEIDHLVMLAPNLERKIAELEDQGIELRRLREGETGMGAYRQAFFRIGRPILEVVEANEPERLWGITFTTADIDAAAALLGDKLGRVKDAVQPGRRIATVRADAGLGVPVALISPKP